MGCLWMNIYFTEVFRLVHHFTCIYTSSWISHTSDSHKSFNIDIYISFVLPAVRASFIQGLYFWFRVFKVIIPVYQYITKFFLRFSTLATGTLRSWSARHQFDACASRWCPTDANPSVPMVRAISTFSFVFSLWIQHLIDILPEFLQTFMQHLTKLDCIIMALDCICKTAVPLVHQHQQWRYCSLAPNGTQSCDGGPKYFNALKQDCKLQQADELLYK